MTYDLPKELREIANEIAMGDVLPAKSIFPSMAADEIVRLREERDMWHARAFAMFWKLPGDLKIGDLRRDSEAALKYIVTDSN